MTGSKSNASIVKEFVQALVARDLEVLGTLCTIDMIVDYPQSGERIRGWRNIRAVLENYPSGLPLDLEGRVFGSEDRWVVGPSFNVLRIEGSGDSYTIVGSARYPDGRIWTLMSLLELRSGKVSRSIEVYGEPFEPPSWRAQWVEDISRPMTLS